MPVFIGLPGELPRLAIEETDRPSLFLRSGEVALASSEIRPYRISTDGLSLEVVLDGLKRTVWEQVKAARDAAIDGGAATPFGVVDSYDAARLNIAGAAQAAALAASTGQSFSVTWTMRDNEAVALDGQQMITVGIAVMAHVDACHERGRTLRDEINNAEDEQTLLAIDINSGWPE